MAHHKNNKANNQQTLTHPAFSSPNIKTKRATSKHFKKTLTVRQNSNKANNQHILKQQP